MIPISFKWNTQDKSFSIQWGGGIGAEWREGRVSIRILGGTVPFPIGRVRVEPPRRFPIRWVYLKGMFSFITDWRIKEIEGAISFQDPMINGVLYGWANVVRSWNPDQKIHLSVNFLEENWCKGEIFTSPRALFFHLRKWIFPMFREIRGRKIKRR